MKYDHCHGPEFGRRHIDSALLINTCKAQAPFSIEGAISISDFQSLVLFNMPRTQNLKNQLANVAIKSPVSDVDMPIRPAERSFMWSLRAI